MFMDLRALQASWHLETESSNLCENTSCLDPQIKITARLTLL